MCVEFRHLKCTCLKDDFPTLVIEMVINATTSYGDQSFMVVVASSSWLAPILCVTQPRAFFNNKKHRENIPLSIMPSDATYLYLTHPQLR